VSRGNKIPTGTENKNSYDALTSNQVTNPVDTRLFQFPISNFFGEIVSIPAELSDLSDFIASETSTLDVGKK